MPCPRRGEARFFAPKHYFTGPELEYRTEVDGIVDCAIGAVLLLDDGSEGIAIGRFVRLPHRPDSAKAAVVVLDAWQNRGIGTRVFNHLVAAARECGIRSFHAEVLPDHDAI